MRANILSVSWWQRPQPSDRVFCSLLTGAETNDSTYRVIVGAAGGGARDMDNSEAHFAARGGVLIRIRLVRLRMHLGTSHNMIDRSVSPYDQPVEDFAKGVGHVFCISTEKGNVHRC